MRRFVGGLFGLILGAAIGVPVSYLFQNPLVRLFGIGDYCSGMLQNLSALFRAVDKNPVAQVFLVTVGVCGVLGMLLGALIVGSGRKREHPNYHDPRRGFPSGPPPLPPRPPQGPGPYSI